MSKRKSRHTRNSKKLKTNMATPEEQKQFLTFYNTNDFIQAQSYAKRLTQRYPKDAFGWKVLGSCLHKNGHIEAAQEALERSIELNENDAQAQHLMARAWFDLGEPLTALQFAGKAVTLEPEFAQGHHTLAEILTESDQDDDALKHALKAEALGYNLNACLFVQSHIYAKRRHYQKAFDSVSKLLEREPDNAFVQNEMGNLYKDLGRFEEAEIAYKRALSIKPDFDTAFSNLVICMHYNPNVSADTISSTIQEWGNHFNQEIATYSHTPVSSDAVKTLRIGLVSPGFRMHPVGQMILTGLENLEPGFELHFYSTNNADDVLTQRLKQIATRWNLVRHLDQKALAEQIYQDGIDILIDLSGFGEGSRLRTMSLKPAPLVIKWVGGLINTMGLPCFDYMISDQHETPEGSDSWYTEKLIRMPDDYICYLPAPDAPAIKALPAMSNGYITLGCFNNPAKINSQLLKEWAVLMHELPNSRLFLKSGQYENEEYCSRVRTLMYEQGIEPERLILEGPSKHKDLLDAYNRVDIALDTWPYSGGLTTCEAFMMGVPVVTFPGPTFAGRHSATHLINAGMPELVVNNWAEYRQRVVELSSDITNLSVIRACLRQFLIQSPVCNKQDFGKYLSKTLKAIWQRHCLREQPAALKFSANGEPLFTAHGRHSQTQVNYKFVHICFNNLHSEAVIKLIEAEQCHGEASHLVLVEKNRSMPNVDVNTSLSEHAHYFTATSDLERVIDICLSSDIKGVFFHSLFFDWQKALLKSIGKSKTVIWSIWGGDLYSPLKNGTLDQDLLSSIDYAATVEKGDFDLLAKHAPHIRYFPFRYASSMDFSEVPVPSEKENIIIIGNSGDPANNHIDIIKNLSLKPDCNDYRYILPMGYNAPKGYIQAVEGALDDAGLVNAEILKEMILPTDYFTLIARSKMLITAHDRQQAVSNISASLYFGNTTVLKRKINLNNEELTNPVWERAQQDSLAVSDYEDLKIAKSLHSFIHTPHISELEKTRINSLYNLDGAAKLFRESMKKII